MGRDPPHPAVLERLDASRAGRRRTLPTPRRIGPAENSERPRRPLLRVILWCRAEEPMVTALEIASTILEAAELA